MIELRNDYWAVEVPEWLDSPTYQIEQSLHEIIDGDGRQDQLVIRHTGRSCGSPLKKIFIDIPPGTWQIVCTSKEATEEQAASIVQVISNGKISGRPQYRRYDRDPVKDMPARSWTRDARHAFETLLASKGCDLTKNLHGLI